MKSFINISGLVSNVGVLALLLGQGSQNQFFVPLLVFISLSVVVQLVLASVLIVRVSTVYMKITIVKGISWDRRWIAPSIGIFSPHMLIFLQICISNHETKQSSKFQTDPSPNCTIDVWNINCWLSKVYFLLSYIFFVSHCTWPLYILYNSVTKDRIL